MRLSAVRIDGLTRLRGFPSHRDHPLLWAAVRCSRPTRREFSLSAFSDARQLRHRSPRLPFAECFFAVSLLWLLRSGMFPTHLHPLRAGSDRVKNGALRKSPDCPQVRRDISQLPRAGSHPLQRGALLPRHSLRTAARALASVHPQAWKSRCAPNMAYPRSPAPVSSAMSPARAD